MGGARGHAVHIQNNQDYQASTKRLAFRLRARPGRVCSCAAMGKAKSTSAAKGVKIKKERSPTAGGGDGLSRSRLIAAATAQEEA